MYFITLFPVSINGLGLQEVALTAIFTELGGISTQAALVLMGLDGGVAVHPCGFRAPHESQLDDGLSGLGDGTVQLGAIAGALEIAFQAAPVRRRRGIHHPAQRRADSVQD